MSKNQIIVALVVLCLVGIIWGSVQDKKSTSLERQLTALKAQSPNPDEGAIVDDSAVKQAQAELEELRSMNKALLEKAATLNGTISSQKAEIAGLIKQNENTEGSSEIVDTMQSQLEKCTAELAEVEAKLVAAQSLCDEKTAALAAAEEAQAGLEEVKNTLANSVDEYSSKSQKLSAEVDAANLRTRSLAEALEERTKLLVRKDEELARTKLNMNVLLSKIAAQNNSLAILEETRVAMTKELATKFLIIEELEHQLNEQVVEDTTIVAEEHAQAIVPVEPIPAEEAPVTHH